MCSNGAEGHKDLLVDLSPNAEESVNATLDLFDSSLVKFGACGLVLGQLLCGAILNGAMIVRQELAFCQSGMDILDKKVPNVIIHCEAA